MGKTIVITNRKGGCGKSTTAANLGIGLARQGKKVLCIDTDSLSRSRDNGSNAEERVITKFEWG